MVGTQLSNMSATVPPFFLLDLGILSPTQATDARIAFWVGQLY